MKLFITFFLFFLSTFNIIAQYSTQSEMHEIFCYVSGESDTLDSVIFRMVALSGVYNKELDSIVTRLDTAFAKNQWTGDLNVPIPSSSDKYGISHDITPGPWPKNTFGYGLYKFQIGWYRETNLPNTYEFYSAFSFNIDYRDSDFSDEYDPNDIWLQYDMDNIVTIGWDSVSEINDTIQNGGTYRIWEEKIKSSNQDIQNLDNLWGIVSIIAPKIQSITNDNSHPRVNITPVQTWNGTSEYDIYRLFSPSYHPIGTWYYITTTANEYYIDPDVVIINGTGGYVFYKARVKINNMYSPISTPKYIAFDYLQKPGSDFSDENTVLTTELINNYPNPFNPKTQISYNIDQDSQVSLKVYNSIGIEVKTLVEGFKSKGKYSAEFDESDLASGIYFYTLSTNQNKFTKKMLLIK